MDAWADSAGLDNSFEQAGTVPGKVAILALSKALIDGWRYLI